MIGREALKFLTKKNILLLKSKISVSLIYNQILEIYDCVVQRKYLLTILFHVIIFGVT